MDIAVSNPSPGPASISMESIPKLQGGEFFYIIHVKLLDRQVQANHRSRIALLRADDERKRKMAG